MLKTCDLFIIHTYLAIIGAIKGTSQTKINLRLEFLKCTQCFRNLCLLYRIRKTDLPEYLFNTKKQSSIQHLIS